MKSTAFAILSLVLSAASGYHDPDLNYHLSQLQKLQGCNDNNGYSYPAPAVQLTTTGIKVPAAPAIQTAQTYQYSNAGYLNSNVGYTNAAYTGGVAYKAPILQNGYLPPPVTTYQAPSLGVRANYAAAATSKEVHGYATSAGLSSAATRTVIPQATYAQAPIIAKVTAAPLIAKFSVSPAKTTYVAQSFAAQAAGSARASLNSYGAVQTGGPVVSQVYAAPAATYATSSALNNRQPQVFTQTSYSPVPSQTVSQYRQTGPVYGVNHFTPSAPVQYATSSVNYGASAGRYFNPAQYTAPATQYVTPVTHYGVAPAQVAVSAPASHVQYSAPVVTQYASPAVAQYSSQQYAASGAAQYATTNVAVNQHIQAPVVKQVVAPVQTHAAISPAIRVPSPGAVKNAHSDFVENYDAHPRYAYEYSVNDPHTGDIKQQKEERDGEVVKGQYSLVEPDGSVRTVSYVADWETGFHADVRNSKDNQH